MKKKTIAIIEGGVLERKKVKMTHEEDMVEALKDEYNIRRYGLYTKKGLRKLVEDAHLHKIDLAFNNSSGHLGGDGTIEGLLALLRVNFIGSQMLATAIGFDKKMTKRVLEKEGLPVIHDLTVGEEDWKRRKKTVLGRIRRKVGYPLIVKAVRGADSIAVSLCKKEAEIPKAINAAFKEDDKAILEQFVDKRMEVTCTAFGQGARLRAFDVVEYVYEHEFLSYELKTGGHLLQRRAPARISQKLAKKIQRYAVSAHRVLGCRDYSRTDMVIDRENKIYILEVNVHAGLGKKSPTSISAKSTYGWDYPTFLKKLVELAMRRGK